MTLGEAAVEAGEAESEYMAAPVESIHAALPESTSSIDTEASCTLKLQMEVIHDFWRERTGMYDASPDASLQALAAETTVEPPTLPPLCPSTDGEGELTLGADGVPAPWQRRQRRRMGLASSSASAVQCLRHRLWLLLVLSQVPMPRRLRGPFHASPT